MKKYISPETAVVVYSTSELLQTSPLKTTSTHASIRSTVLSKEEIWSDEEEEW